MLNALASHRDAIAVVGGLGSACLTLVGVTFFAYSMDARIAQMQDQNDRWLDMDTEQAAEQVELIESVRGGLEAVSGRLDGAGGGALLYQLGLRDGAASCSR